MQKVLWQMLLEVLQSCENPHGYSVSGLSTAIFQKFSTSVTRKAIVRNLKRLQAADVGLQIAIIRTGPFRTPVTFYRLLANQ